MFIKSVIDDRGLSGKVTFVAANDMGSGEELFVLSAGEVSRLPFPLDEGSEVDENIYDTLKAASERTGALTEAARILSIGQRSRRTLLYKLKTKGYSPEAAEHAVKILEKKGYLNSEFRLFHLTDQETKEIDYHYHDFDKITIFIRGKVNYMIEGRSYDLKPYDIVLVKQGDIHKLTVDNSCPYERIIVYISPNFMNAYQTESYDLSYCFQKADQEHSNVLRIPSPEKSSLFRSISNLEHSFTDGGYASELYRQVMFLEFMIHLNRAVRKNRLEYIDTVNCNEKVLAILDYVGEHLCENLSIDLIAGQFYISKYYMMRLFKQETGYTLGQYISQKRLLLAKELLSSGVPGTQVCYDCGFKDYSTFSRAYKQLFGVTPSGRTCP